MANQKIASADTIVRAIKARLALDQGVDAPAILEPISVAFTEPYDEGCNWLLHAEGASESSLKALIVVSRIVARNFKLETRPDRY